MSTRNREVTFVVKARNAAKAALRAVSQSLGKVGQSANRANRAMGVTERHQKRLKRSSDALKRSMGDMGRKIGDASRAVAILQGPLGGVATRFDRMRSLVSGTGLAFATFAVSVTAAGFAMARSVSVTAAYEQDLLRIEGQVRATGGAAGWSTEQIRELTNEIGDMTNMSRSGARRAAAAVLSFRSIQGETFQRTMELAADISEATGTDLQQNAVRLARALEDPATNMTLLARSGTTFSDQTVELVRSLQEQGRLFEAQNVILDEVANQYGGTARAAAQGLAGALDTIGEILKDMPARFAILSGGYATMRDFAQNVVGALRWVENNLEMLATRFNEVKDTIIGFLATAAAFSAMRLAVQAIAGLRTALIGAKLAMDALTASMMRNPLGALAVAISAIIGLLYGFRNTQFEIEGQTVSLGAIMAEVWERVKTVVTAFFGYAVRVITAYYDLVFDTFRRIGLWVRDVFMNIVETVRTWGQNVSRVFTALINWAKDEFFQRFADFYNEYIAPVFEMMINVTRPIRKALGDVIVFFSQGLRGLIDLAVRFVSIFNEDLAVGMREALSNLEGFVSDAIDSAQDQYSAAVETVRQGSAEILDSAMDTFVDPDRWNALASALRDNGEVRAAFEEALGGGFDQFISDVNARNAATQAQIAARRQVSGEGGNMNVLGAAGLETADPNGALEDRRRSIESLTRAYAPHILRMRERQQALADLSELERVATLTGEELTAALEALGMTESELHTVIDRASRGLNRQGTIMGEVAAAAQEYVQKAQDGMSTVASATQSIMGGMEDALVKFTTSGKFSFKDMVNSMIADLARLAARQFMMRTATSLFGIPMPGFHKGGLAGGTPTFTRNVDPSVWANAPRYHTGGLAGGSSMGLKSGEVPIIAKRNEAILPTVRMPNGDFGVQTTGGGGAPITMNAPITINMNGGGNGNGGMSPEAMEGMSKALRASIEQVVTDTMAKHLRSGGMSSGSMARGGM